MKSEPIKYPKCGAESPAKFITHAVAQVWGKRGGAAQIKGQGILCGRNLKS